MVARPGPEQMSWNAGELSGDVSGRYDIKQFYAGASRMRNCEPVPQGGFEQSAGTEHKAFFRGTLTEVIHTPSFNLGPHAAAGVTIASSVFVQAPVDSIDLIGLSCTQALSAALQVQVFTTAWENIGSPVYLRTTAQNRRISLPAGTFKNASQMRVQLIVTPGAAVTFTLSSIKIWRELAVGTVGRTFEYSFSTDDAFTVQVTPGHADIFKEDVFVASVALGVTAGQMETLSYEQRLDSLFLFHKDLAPIQIKRDRADTDWSGEPAPFVNVPLIDYGATYGNIVNDIWRITITWSSGPVGLILELSVNGENITGVTLATGPDWAGFATALQAAIEAVPSVGPGVIVGQSVVGPTATITVEFAGATNRGGRFTLVPRIVNVQWAAATASVIQYGDPGGEEIMSVSRGYPTTGAFYQDRFFLGGFRSQGIAVAGSLSAEYFDLNAKVEAASGGILFRLDTDGQERILHIRRDRHLVLFTDQAEYYVSDRAITRGTPPNIPESSRNGAAPGFRPVKSEAGLIYIGSGRSIVYYAVYSDVSQKYESAPISLLANHLCKTLKSGAMQRASSSTSADRLYMTRDDGLLVIGKLIQNQEVTAFCGWETDGLVQSVCVDGKNQVYLGVLRTIAGVQRLVRERMVEGQWLHQAVQKVNGAPSATISGLSTLEGATVWAIADGYPEGPFVVTGGTITLKDAATTVWVGRWKAPVATSLKFPRQVGERTILARPIRVHTVHVELAGTSSLAIQANDGPVQDVPMVKTGQFTDQPIPAIEGNYTVSGLSGYTEKGLVTLTQKRPGYFKIKSTQFEARL